MSRPEAAASVLAKGGMLSNTERTATCECGRTFTQTRMSVRELAAAERMGIRDQFLASVPDGFVPVHCPPCESKDLARQAAIDDARASRRFSQGDL